MRLDSHSGHAEGKRVGPLIRRRLRRVLRELRREELEMQRFLGLSVPPRLSVVDEGRVLILRPADRDRFELDLDD